MIEEIVISYLKETLKIPVFSEDKNLEEYIVVGKTGSSRNNYINKVTIFIQSYSTSKYKASLLNERVKEAMDSIVILDTIYSSKLNNDYDYTDTNKKKYRYQAVYDISF